MKPDGGAAFPSAPFQNGNGDWYMDGQYGMTLRDYFAAKALPACIRACSRDPLADGQTLEQLFAAAAYRCADAMLTERAK